MRQVKATKKKTEESPQVELPHPTSTELSIREVDEEHEKPSASALCEDEESAEEEISEELALPDSRRIRRFQRLMRLMELEAREIGQPADWDDLQISYQVKIRFKDQDYVFENQQNVYGLFHSDNAVDAPMMLEQQIDMATRPIRNLLMRHLQDVPIQMGGTDLLDITSGR